ncbi:MAG: class I SAM-dependent methyltransferase [Anaerolineae bacterium]|nr:class I SAM-dependent methyltransferase [Anaerolineae bacterium]
MEHVSCGLCGADDAFVRFPSTMAQENGRPADPEHFRCTTLSYGQHYRIVQCRQCGLVYTDPRRPASAIWNDYEQVVDERYLQEREGRIATFRRNIRPLEVLVPGQTDRRLLDVGAHVGVFVEVAQERGWQAWGLEPSRWAVDMGRAQGLRMIQGGLQSAELDADAYDAVTMWDVIEHLLDPLADLREVARVLKPGGVALVHTINIDSAFARLMGKRWPWLVEMHTYFFSPRTLGAMVEKAGLRVESWHVQGRYLHLGYLLSRLSGWSAALGRAAEGAAIALGIQDWLVPVNFGDLFTLYARKPQA